MQQTTRGVQSVLRRCLVWWPGQWRIALEMFKVWDLEDKIRPLEIENAMTQDNKEMRNEVTGLILETWSGREGRERWVKGARPMIYL
jgi:sarcosine oxidase delta subunit